jgi:cytochrome c biogenesis protein CcmG/thiol:disulfide interchange protein DsbE
MLLAGCTSGAPTASGQSSSGQSLTRLHAEVRLPPCPAGVGQGLPKLSLGCLSGGPKVALRARGPGTPMLVNIWATWCSPCVREVPMLVSFSKAAGGRVGLLGVLTEDEQAQALEFASQFHMTYTSVLDDDGKVLRTFSPGPPATLFVDLAGRVVYVKRGEIHSFDDLRSLVRIHLGVDVAP